MILGELQVHQFLEMIPVGFCVISEDFTITRWNHILQEWTGIRAEEAVEQNLARIVPSMATPLIRERFAVAWMGGGPVILSSRFHPNLFPRRGGSESGEQYQRITIIPFFTSGKGAGAMIVVEDMTALTLQVLMYRETRDQIRSELEERTRAEQALAIANNKLNTLAAVTRHDLQNLLTSLEGYIILSLKQNPAGVLLGYLERIQAIGQTMRRQVAFTRDYQEMGIHAPGWVSIGTMIRSTAAGSLFADITTDVRTGDLEIYGDPLIEKAVYNLMENAVRHGGHTTRITVTAARSRKHMRVIIADDGEGIPAALKSRIFERGFGSNTGLGLFLTREILAITGIQITEEGTEGEGARFVLHIPGGHWRSRDGNRDEPGITAA